MNTPNTPQQDRQFLHTMTAGAYLPFTQSTIVASVVAIGTWLIMWMIFDVVDPHKPAIVLFFITWIGMIAKLYRHWFTLTSVEQFLQQDLNGDGMIGDVDQPKEKPERVVIELLQVKENGHVSVGDKSDMITLSCSKQQLHLLAMGVTNGIPIAEKKWTPLKEGKPFSINQWRKICDEMRAQGAIEYVDKDHPEQGQRLTDTGKAVMQHYAALSPTTP